MGSPKDVILAIIILQEAHPFFNQNPPLMLQSQKGVFVTYTVGEFKFPTGSQILRVQVAIPSHLGAEMTLPVAHDSHHFENPPSMLQCQIIKSPRKSARLQ